MEFLLINHPLDCPVCDQGGECDLQDQAIAYGRDGSRFEENKRLVEEKQMGPLIKTIMTRCIQCTRCVRFATEIAGVDDLGLVNRGENAEITTYLEKAVASELTGNLIDVCPVGALTSKPYAFTARPWELRKTETIDVMDAVGANIRVDVRGREVLRILPRLHEDVNEEWLADKSRYIWDGLKTQRLDRPYIREGGKLRPATWDEAFSLAADKLTKTPAEKVACVAGDLVSLEAMKAAQDLMGLIGSPNLDCRQDGAQIGVNADGTRAARGSYLFNSAIAGIEQADAILLVGTNPRLEAPLINTRLRKSWLANMDLKIGLVGAAPSLTFDYDHLGTGADALGDMIDGKGDFAKAFSKAERPAIIVGMGVLTRPDAKAVLASLAKLADKAGVIVEGWNGYNVLHIAAARVGGLDLGFLPGEGGRGTAEILAGAENGDIEVIYNLGADELDTTRLAKAFVIYQGHHGDAGASNADIILPAAAYTEQNGLYVNTEGRVQMAVRAYFPFGEAREDWAILRALSGKMGKALPYDDQFTLRTVVFKTHPELATLDTLPEAGGLDLKTLGSDGKIDQNAFTTLIADYYLTNPVARASKIMAECSAVQGADAALAAE